MACEGLRTCDNPGSLCLDNKYCFPACEPLPLDLRVNPGGQAFAGIPNVPPVLEEVFDAECDETIEDVVISMQSGQSFYRTADPIANQRYRARLFLFQVDNPGTYTIRVLNNTFAPFITVSRTFGVFWQSSGTILTFDVSVEQTGPMVIEVTTETAQTFGSFDLEIDCGSIVSTEIFYWKMDVAEGGLPFTTPPSSGGRNLILSGPPGPNTELGKINNAIFTGIMTNDPGIDFASGSFTVRLWMKQVGFFNVGDIPFSFKDPSFGQGVFLRCNSNTELVCRVASQQAAITGSVFVPQNTWNMFVFGWDDDAKRAFISFNGGLKSPSSQRNITSFNIVNGQATMLSTANLARFDEVVIYLGKAWSDAEIANDYNGGIGRTYPDVP